jgi:hypothetical protein
MVLSNVSCPRTQRKRRFRDMTERMPPIPEELWQVNRNLTEKVLDRAASDPQWKQLLLDDPEAAMRTANFPELQQIEQMQASAGASREGEVRGQDFEFSSSRGDIEIEIEGGGFSGFSGGRLNCYWWTYYWS